MTLAQRLGDPTIRALVAADAVAEAQIAVGERSGLPGAAAQVGLDTINRVRPGFLQGHVYALLPDMAEALEPHWLTGAASGNASDHLEANAGDVTATLLEVTDGYVAKASDARAIAVYNYLRPRADRRIAEQMPRIAKFIERHTQED